MSRNMKMLFLFFILFCFPVFLTGCNSSDSYNDNRYYGYEEEDRYVAYIAVADWNNGGKLLFIDRQTLEYSFTRDANGSPESVAYFRPNRYFYVGGGKYITSIYGSKNTSNTQNLLTESASLLAANNYYLFASFDRNEVKYYIPDTNGALYTDAVVGISGKGAQVACSPDNYEICVSGTEASGNDLSIYSGDRFGFLGIIADAGNAGVTFSSGRIYAVDTNLKRLNLVFADSAKVDKFVDLAALGAVNPWGVAYAGSKIYVTDCVASGKVFVFDYNLNYLKTISDVGSFPKYISGDPERNYAYVSNQGDGFGNNASLAVIDPASDTKLKTIGLAGHKPMGIAVMPWNR